MNSEEVVEYFQACQLIKNADSEQQVYLNARKRTLEEATSSTGKKHQTARYVYK